MSYPLNWFEGIWNCCALQSSLKLQFCYFLLVWYYLFAFMTPPHPPPLVYLYESNYFEWSLCGLWDAAMSYPFNLFKGIRNCFALQLSLKSQFFLLLAGLLLLVWINEKKNFRDFLPLSSILLAASLSNPHFLIADSKWMEYCNRWIPCCCASVQ